MNDVGNVHPAQNTPPLGIEVQVLAFAFSRADALGNTTFYKYRIINKSGTDIEDTYVSVFSDPDLGDAVDDYVGSDGEAGFGYVYNADNADLAYGTPPPAAGYDFFQGPIVPNGPDENGPEGTDTDPDTLGTTAFTYFQNVTGPQGDPNTGEEIYNYQQGLWGDGSTIRAFADGFQEVQGDITKFAFPGDPVTGQAWSEVNSGNGVNPPGDRRFAIHTGPFTLADGDVQDIVFGIVFAQGTSNLNSITVLRTADQLAQTAYDANFELAPPPPPPPVCVEGSATLAPGSGNCLEAVEENGRLTLVWGYPTTSPNFGGQFEVFDALLAGSGVSDSTYNFEGFNVYAYPTQDFEGSDRELIATFDVVNGITEIRDELFDPELGDTRQFVVARGTDSGLEYSFDVTGLTNYTDYYFGVSAYSYSPFSIPKVIESSVSTVTGRPSSLTQGVETQSVQGDTLIVTTASQTGTGGVRARIVDPTRITGATYEVRFFTPLEADGTPAIGATTYSIVNTTTGETVLDGQAFYTQTTETMTDAQGNIVPIAGTGDVFRQGTNVAVVDGFSFDILGPEPGFSDFQLVANASGPLNPVRDGAMDPNGTGFPDGDREVDNLNSPVPGQMSTNNSRWGIHTACSSIVAGQALADCGYETGLFNFVDRTLRGEANNRALRAGDSNYEIRFTGGTDNFAYVYYSNPKALITVPFQLWDVGRTADSADDVRLFPLLNEWPTPLATGTTGNNIYDLGADHPTSGGLNDPQLDRIYWRRPLNEAAGQAGYAAAVAAAQAQGSNYDLTGLGAEIMADMVLVNLNGCTAGAATCNAPRPENGSVFRIVTNNPNQAGDVFRFNTAGLQPTAATAESQQEALDRIAAVPNPYYGTSTYETGNLSRVIRFTNLPEQIATIRIFTVSGSLVQTLRKEGSSRSLDWNLETSNNLPVASGMYLVHVDVEGVGERTLKIGVINRRTQITVF
jgi:hypothetical protein